jgi:LuxR family maltose regulon positive regulatory protein
LFVVAAQVQLALLLKAAGRDREAVGWLTSSLEAAQGGALLPYQELFVHQPQWLREQLMARPDCAVAAELLRYLPQTQGPQRTRLDSQLTEALSSRELAVLQLIAQGCSNQEISEQLFISLHTVKTHARHINGKLGVERRTQAVARAKGLGLLR